MWLSGLASAGLEVVLLPTLPESLARHSVEMATADPTPRMWLGLIGGSLSLILTIWGSVQLCRLKKGGRRIFLVGIVGTVVTTPFTGPVIFNPAGMLLYDVSSILGGVILGYTYFAGVPHAVPR